MALPIQPRFVRTANGGGMGEDADTFRALNDWAMVIIPDIAAQTLLLVEAGRTFPAEMRMWMRIRERGRFNTSEMFFMLLKYLSLIAFMSSVFVLESQDVLGNRGCLALSWITQMSLGLCTTVVSACLAWRCYIIFQRTRRAAYCLSAGVLIQLAVTLGAMSKIEKYSHSFGGSCTIPGEMLGNVPGRPWYQRAGLWFMLVCAIFDGCLSFASCWKLQQSVRGPFGWQKMGRQLFTNNVHYVSLVCSINVIQFTLLAFAPKNVPNLLWLSIVVEILVGMHLIISEQDTLHGHGLERRKVLAAAGGYGAGGAGGAWGPHGGAAVGSAGDTSSGSRRPSKAFAGGSPGTQVVGGGKEAVGGLRGGLGSVRSLASAGLRKANSGPLFNGGGQHRAGPEQEPREVLDSDELELGAFSSHSQNKTRSTDEDSHVDPEAYEGWDRVSHLGHASAGSCVPVSATVPGAGPGSTTGGARPARELPQTAAASSSGHSSSPFESDAAAVEVSTAVVQEARIRLPRGGGGVRTTSRPPSWTSKPSSPESGVRVDVDVDVTAAPRDSEGEAVLNRRSMPVLRAAAAAAAAAAKKETREATSSPTPAEVPRCLSVPLPERSPLDSESSSPFTPGLQSSEAHDTLAAGQRIEIEHADAAAADTRGALSDSTHSHGSGSSHGLSRDSSHSHAGTGVQEEPASAHAATNPAAQRDSAAYRISMLSPITPMQGPWTTAQGQGQGAGRGQALGETQPEEGEPRSIRTIRARTQARLSDVEEGKAGSGSWI